MKITAQEEYGLRLLIRIGACQEQDGMSIPQLSDAEGLSSHYVAKLTRILRLAGFVNSTPGYKGGYVLARPASGIIINQVLQALGGALSTPGISEDAPGSLRFCTHSVDCSSRSLWQMIQLMLNEFLDKITLHDLINTDEDSGRIFHELLRQGIPAHTEKNI